MRGRCVDDSCQCVKRVQCVGVSARPLLSGADLGEVRWVPLFTDILDLLVLIITPSVFDTQRLRASLVWLLYNLRPIAHIDTATGVFGKGRST